MRPPRRVIRKARKRRSQLPFRYSLLLSFAIFLCLTAFGLWMIDREIRPTIIHIANLETQKIATSAINYAVKETIDEVDMNELIEIKYDEEGSITSVGFDSHIYNAVVTESVDKVQEYIRLMERGLAPTWNLERREANDLTSQINVLHEIPLGQATNNSFLAQRGPKIPVKLTAIGDVDISLNEKIKSSGINNTWIRVSLDLEVEIQVVIPFATQTDEVTTTVPVGMIYVHGKVPHFYGGGGQGGSPLPAVIVED